MDSDSDIKGSPDYQYYMFRQTGYPLNCTKGMTVGSCHPR